MSDGVIQRSDDSAHLTIHGTRLAPFAQPIAPRLDILAHDIFEPHAAKVACAPDSQAEPLASFKGARTSADGPLVPHIRAECIAHGAARWRAMHGAGDRRQ